MVHQHGRQALSFESLGTGCIRSIHPVFSLDGHYYLTVFLRGGALSRHVFLTITKRRKFTINKSLPWVSLQLSGASTPTSLRKVVDSQPRPQGLLLVQNGGLEKPLVKAAEILQESWSILSRDTRWNGFFFSVLQPCLFSCNLKPLFKQNEDISSCFTWQCKILTNVWSHFWNSLGQGFLRPTILNEERLHGFHFWIQICFYADQWSDKMKSLLVI